jgi:hypothetical protein
VLSKFYAILCVLGASLGQQRRDRAVADEAAGRDVAQQFHCAGEHPVRAAGRCRPQSHRRAQRELFLSFKLKKIGKLN